MANMSESIIVDNLSKASARIRAAIFLNLTLCAVVFSNIYLQTLSFTNKQMQLLYETVVELDRQMEDICKNNVNAVHYVNTMCIDNIKNQHNWLTDDIKEFSKLVSRKSFAVNTLGEFQMPKAKIPAIGIEVHANDLNLICGLFMIILSLGLLFSANQIDDIIDDSSIAKTIDDYAHEIIHIFSTIYIKKHSILRKITVIMLFTPGLTMLLATIVDLSSIINYDFQTIVMGMTVHILISMTLMTAITVSLFWSAKEVKTRWSFVFDKLLEKASRPK